MAHHFQAYLTLSGKDRISHLTMSLTDCPVVSTEDGQDQAKVSAEMPNTDEDMQKTLAQRLSENMQDQATTPRGIPEEIRERQQRTFAAWLWEKYDESQEQRWERLISEHRAKLEAEAQEERQAKKARIEEEAEELPSTPCLPLDFEEF